MRTLMWTLMLYALAACIGFAALAATGPVLHGLMWIACGVCGVFSVACGLLLATIRVPR